MRQIKTQQGDMWDLIAKRELGDEYTMNQLFAINPTLLMVQVFDAGVTINIPDDPIPTDVDGLPPWRTITN